MDIDTQRSRIAGAWQARYGDAPPPSPMPWNDTIGVLLRHHSVRAYRPDPLPEGTLPLLVAAAQSAATSSNMQTWSVVAVTDPTKKAALARVASDQKHIEQCPLLLVFLADLSRAERLAERQGEPLENLAYFETFLVAAIDAALAAQNAVVAAESLGLSTVYIGALRNGPETVAAELGLPKGAMGVFGLCVGYADTAAAGGTSTSRSSASTTSRPHPARRPSGKSSPARSRRGGSAPSRCRAAPGTTAWRWWRSVRSACCSSAAPAASATTPPSRSSRRTLPWRSTCWWRACAASPPRASPDARHGVDQGGSPRQRPRRYPFAAGRGTGGVTPSRAAASQSCPQVVVSMGMPAAARRTASAFSRSLGA